MTVDDLLKDGPLKSNRRANTMPKEGYNVKMSEKKKAKLAQKFFPLNEKFSRFERQAFHLKYHTPCEDQSGLPDVPHTPASAIN